MSRTHTQYAGKPTHSMRILEYLDSTPFKQMAVTRIATDLDIDLLTMHRTLSDMQQAGRITRGKNGRASIVVLAKKG
jgi:DNA-binding IclR family transcriptional regulator